MKKSFPLVTLTLCLAAANPLFAETKLLKNYTSPASAISAHNKGTDLLEKGDLVGARHMYDAAIKADPKLYLAIFSRGEISMQEHKWEMAIQDFNAALTVSPGFFIAAVRRGQANEALGHYDLSLADYNRVISLKPMIGSRALAKSARAWVLATCPNAALRNGKQAVEDAKAACNLTSFGKWDYIDTLAAAYAEAGDFDSAIKFEQKAISRTNDPEDIKGAQMRLALYQQHKPYHTPAH